MKITKVKGQYDLCSNNEQWRVAITGLPDKAPAKYLSDTWNIDDEPYVKGLPPSEVVELISERVESYLLSTKRKESREVIQWIRDNSKELDALWAKSEIELKRKAIARLEEEIEDLAEMADHE